MDQAGIRDPRAFEVKNLQTPHAPEMDQPRVADVCPVEVQSIESTETAQVKQSTIADTSVRKNEIAKSSKAL